MSQLSQQLPTNSPADMGAHDYVASSGFGLKVLPTKDKRRDGSASDLGRTPPGEPVPTVVRHLTMALSGHLRRMRHSGLSVPYEIEELTHFLISTARTRQGATAAASASASRHHASVADRLLVTKSEVAERLSVSVRTVERLVSAGRLTQVYVEHSARIRVKDLVVFVESLAESSASGSSRHEGVDACPARHQ